MTTRVAVFGARGRMGAAACDAIDADPDLTVAARIGRGDPLDLADCDVAVELSTPWSVRENTLGSIAQGLHVVVGATGLTPDDLRDIGSEAESKSVGVLVAPNFALGAVLMMQFAEKAARFFDHAEIIERHHEKKLDSPSGTASRTAALMNEARGHRPGRGSEGEASSDARGLDVEGIHIHSLRSPGSVAHQEVIFGGQGETLTIKHDSVDRSSFMPGIVLAVKRVSGLRGLTVGLEHLLDL